MSAFGTKRTSRRIASSTRPRATITEWYYEFSRREIWVWHARLHFVRSYSLQNLMYISGYGQGVPKILMSPIRRTVVFVRVSDVRAINPYDIIWKRTKIRW